MVRNNINPGRDGGSDQIKSLEKRDGGFIDANISVACNVMSTMAVKLIGKTRPTSVLSTHLHHKLGVIGSTRD